MKPKTPGILAPFTDDIFAGNLAAGRPVNERSFRERHGLKRTAYRAMIKAAEEEEFVAKKDGQLCVVEPSLKEIQQNLTVRLPLETAVAGAAALIAKQAPNQLLLEENSTPPLAILDGAPTTTSERAAFFEHDLRFHLSLCDLTGYGYSSRFIRRTYVMQVLVLPFDLAVEHVVAICAEHDRIVSRVFAGDERGAMQAMAHHLIAATIRWFPFARRAVTSLACVFESVRSQLGEDRSV